MSNKRIDTANKTKLEIKWNSNTPLRRGQAKQAEGRDLMEELKAYLRRAGGRGRGEIHARCHNPASTYFTLKNIQSKCNKCQDVIIHVVFF